MDKIKLLTAILLTSFLAACSAPDDNNTATEQEAAPENSQTQDSGEMKESGAEQGTMQEAAPEDSQMQDSGEMKEPETEQDTKS